MAAGNLLEFSNTRLGAVVLTSPYVAVAVVACVAVFNVHSSVWRKTVAIEPPENWGLVGNLCIEALEMAAYGCTRIQDASFADDRYTAVA